MKKLVYVASCADDGGIYTYEWRKGEMTLSGKTPVYRPMYIANEAGKTYVITEGDEKKSKFGTFFSFDNLGGTLTNKSEERSCEGYATCHLSVADGEAYAVNYISGSVIKFPGGKLVTHSGKGVHPTRQTAAHTHMAAVTPDKKFVLVTDLGLDTVFTYDRDLNFVSSAKVPAGYGARHLAFSPDGKYVYCVNELVSSVSAFGYEDGKLSYIDTTLCPVEAEKNTAAAIRLSADGKTLYISNRGENTLVSFAVDGASLTLKQKISCGGDFPRDFALTPCGRYIVCANQYTNDLTIFSLTSGEMRFVSRVPGIENPLCVTFLEVE